MTWDLDGCFLSYQVSRYWRTYKEAQHNPSEGWKAAGQLVDDLSHLLLLHLSTLEGHEVRVRGQLWCVDGS
jgi:hypothetical protein